MFNDQDKNEYRRLLDEIGADYCPNCPYCIFKEFLISAHPSRRLLVQLKNVDRMKLLWSKDLGKDIGWEEAFKKWVEEGNAKKFASVYSDDKSEKHIFQEIISTS